SAARRRRVHHHRLGSGEAVHRVPAHRGLRGVRDSARVLPGHHRRDFCRRVRVRGPTGAQAVIKPRPPRPVPEWLALGLGLALFGWVVFCVAWVARYAVAVRGLTRGVGDTVFYSADGTPWFRLDGQRHDVALSAIAPDLQHAVVAVEDRRFYYHP